MRTITTTTKLNLYAFRELDEEAQDKALYNRAEDLTCINWDNEEFIPDYIARALKIIGKDDNELLAQEILSLGETDLLLELDEDDEVYTKEGERFTY